jgi:hypothetical protein
MLKTSASSKNVLSLVVSVFLHILYLLVIRFCLRKYRVKKFTRLPGPPVERILLCGAWPGYQGRCLLPTLFAASQTLARQQIFKYNHNILQGLSHEINLKTLTKIYRTRPI